MILDELVLHNFGVFRGRQVLDLTPLPGKPLTLVGGLNGHGKTTILDAVQLALYGPLAGPRRGTGYEQYLIQSIHNGVDLREGAAVALSFHVYEDGGRHDYRIYRSWTGGGKRLREHLEVVRDGRRDTNLTARWADHVEGFMPRGIASLFFFDGEQIESLADLDNSQSMLHTAINALLGLDLADRLTADLTVLERRFRERLAPEDERAGVQGLCDQVGQLRLTEEQAAQALAAARVQAERGEKALFAVEERYRLEGGTLFEQRSHVDDALARAKADQRATDEELRDLASGAAPFSLILPQVAALATQADTERRVVADRLLVDVLASRDQSALDVLRSSRASKGAVAALARFFEQDHQVRRAAIAQEPVLGLDGEQLTLAVALLHDVLPDTCGRVRRLLGRRLEHVERIDDLERELAAIPAQDALAALVAELDGARRAAAEAQADYQRAEGHLAAVRAERARADERYERALASATQGALAADDHRRLIEHSGRARDTLQAFRLMIIRRHVDRLAGLVSEALQRLLRKEVLVTDLNIDPKTYRVQLRGQDDIELLPEQLSAGERQLLAVALLWGLARAAGQPLPVIIDTPLGRLDGSHRERLIERYFPAASHQVILLSTDKEIDEAAWSKLRSRTAHCYRLAFDEDAGGTTIVPGYFWEGEA